MLKTIGSPDASGPKIRNSNSKVVKFGVNGGGEELAKKLRKSKDQNLALSQKLSESRKSKDEKSKKPSKSRNLPSFNKTDTGPSFLTSGIREVFNRL